MSKIVGVTVGTPLSLSRIKREIAPDIQMHENKKDNPHGVTKDQVGLGNVDNTSDMDKPVSTAQNIAIADAKQAGTDAKIAADNAQATADTAVTKAEEAKTAAQNAEKNAKDHADSLHKIFTVSVPATGWSEVAPYTQTIAVEGILETDTPHWGVVYSDNALAEKEAFAMVDDLDTADGSVTFTCFEEKPGTDLSVQMEVNR